MTTDKSMPLVFVKQQRGLHLSSDDVRLRGSIVLIQASVALNCYETKEFEI